MKRFSKKKRIAFAILCGALVLLSLTCFLTVRHLSRILPPQQAAERWQGEGETAFNQVSCYLTVDEPITLNKIYAFRYTVLDKLREAGFEADTDTRLFRDAWCVSGKENVSSDQGKGTASVLAVGGNFFDFHPIRLVSGSYLSEEDLMKDRVLLDEELAWLLFGSVDLQGMEMKIAGVPFVVAGVVEREQDFASTRAYTSGMGLYMSYDAYAQLHEDVGATCYELVMAEPVDGYTLGFVQEKFPIGDGEIVENSHRFSMGRLMSLLKSFGTRSMQTHGVIYPYWENAARSVEDWCTLFLLLGFCFAAIPVVTALVLLFLLLKRGKEKLSEDLLPELKDKTEEAVRKQQRKRWEKKNKSE